MQARRGDEFRSFDQMEVLDDLDETHDTVAGAVHTLLHDAHAAPAKMDQESHIPDWTLDFEDVSHVQRQSMQERLGEAKAKLLGDIDRLLPRAGVSNHS